LLSGNIQTCKQGHQEQCQRLRTTYAFSHSSSKTKIDFAKQSFVNALENTRENSPTD